MVEPEDSRYQSQILDKNYEKSDIGEVTKNHPYILHKQNKSLKNTLLKYKQDMKITVGIVIVKKV